MGSCLSLPTPSIEASEEEKLRSREIDKQLKEVDSALFMFNTLIHAQIGEGEDDVAGQGMTQLVEVSAILSDS